MKTTYRLFFFCFIAILALPSCHNEDISTDSFLIERERIVPSTDSVSITGSYSFSGSVKAMKVNIGEQESLIDALSHDLLIEGSDFSVSIGNLKPSTIYYYRYSVDFGSNEPLLTDTKTFSTLETVAETPTVVIHQYPLFNEDSTFARIKCEVVDDGGASVTERGVFWNNLGDPVEGDSIVQHATGGIGIYTVNMEHLELGKTYFFRAYAKNEAGIGYSNDILVIKTNVPAGSSVDILLSCNPPEGGSATGDGSYEAGTLCTVSASANPGYTFVNWTENNEQVSAEAAYTFAATTSRSLVANFTKQAFVITTEVDPEDSGTVTGAGGYNFGELCTLSATPKTGYDFWKWSKGGNTVSSEAEYSFTVDATATYVAHFKIKSYTVSVSADPSDGGTVTGGGSVDYGQSCTVHASPADGFSFDHWTDEGDEVSSNADYTFTVNGNRNLVAHFTANVQQYTISVSANPTNGGTVSGGGTFPADTTIIVTATPSTGFSFVKWTENGNDVSTDANYSFTVTGNRNLVAQFQAQPQQYTVTVSADPTNGGSVYIGNTPGQTQATFNSGASCTVHATANSGFTFVRWTENGSQVSTSANYTFTVTSNRNLVAVFQAQQQTYTITVSANPANGGTVTGGGTYQQGQPCTVSATANNGYVFTNWTENGNLVSSNASYSFNVNGNRNLVANFTPLPPTPTGAINGIFSVSSSQRVYFSQGNLQYRASTQTWRFAANQYDRIGSANSNISQYYDGWIDLFGWGTSGYDHGAGCFQPWSVTMNNSAYYAYGQYTYNLYERTGQADWGYNAISNGGSNTNTWRTLKYTEWIYLFNTRNTASGIRYAKAKVGNINGVILLPDNWSSSYYNLNNTNTSGADFASNTISATQWTTLEQHGAVFLPVTGVRYGNTFSDGGVGHYWSASYRDSDHARDIRFSSESLATNSYYNRYYGQSVRLVCPAQ